MDRGVRELTELLSEAKTIPPLKIEKTVFSVGARGHFENPVSELLAFFIAPSEEHGLGDLFLRALIECARSEEALPSSVDVALEKAPDRQVVTTLGNKLDILLVGRDWTLVVENKIYAAPSNPLQDYANVRREGIPCQALPSPHCSRDV